MTPDQLAKKHSKLYHISEAHSWPTILKHGLRSTQSLLQLFDVPHIDALMLLTKIRPKPVHLIHPIYGRAVLNDNAPLKLQGLAKCLDDGLTPSDWLNMLNSRVFFFTSRSEANNLMQSSGNMGRQKMLLIFDTLSLAKSYNGFMELCPFNSGATNPRSVPRRGLTTFTPLSALDFSEWSRMRGKKDRIREVTLTCDLTNIDRHLLEVIKT